MLELKPSVARDFAQRYTIVAAGFWVTISTFQEDFLFCLVRGICLSPALFDKLFSFMSNPSHVCELKFFDDDEIDTLPCLGRGCCFEHFVVMIQSSWLN
jgi:hypothetical protein